MLVLDSVGLRAMCGNDEGQEKSGAVPLKTATAAPCAATGKFFKFDRLQ
jgi:hypothetical protein